MKRLLIAFALAWSATLHAANFRVTSFNDSGAGSLRFAIEQANATPGADTISGAFTTIVLTSPLPPITDAVSIDLPSIIDGTNAGSADGLVINADDVTISSVTVANFSGDGIVIHGRRDQLTFVTITGNRNGIRIDGSIAGVFSARVFSNAANGIWITATGSGIQIGQPDPLCFGLCLPFPGSDELTGNALAGIRIDGNHNRVDSAWVGIRPSGASPNGGDGIIVNGRNNAVINCVISNNGGYGAQLVEPARFENNDGSCNHAGFVGGSLIEPPVITSARADPTVITLTGVFRGTPETSYRIDFLGIPSSCPFIPDLRVGWINVTTDSAGLATWTVSRAHSPLVRIAAIASREDIEVSGLSHPFPVFISGETRADLSIQTTGPSSARTGQTIEFVTVVANNGPAAVASFQVAIPRPSDTSLISIQAPFSSCYPESLQSCRIFSLAVGESKSIVERYRVTATGGTLNRVATVYHEPGSLMTDPNPANNSSSVSVAVVFDASNIPATSPLILLLLAVVMTAVAFVSMRVD